jgi:hypothetical protein
VGRRSIAAGIWIAAACIPPTAAGACSSFESADVTDSGTSDAQAVPEASEVVANDKPEVRCGSATNFTECDLAAGEVCCVDRYPSGYTEYRCAKLGQCPAPNDAGASRHSFQCDEPGDCPAGQVCCLTHAFVNCASNVIADVACVVEGQCPRCSPEAGVLEEACNPREARSTCPAPRVCERIPGTVFNGCR